MSNKQPTIPFHHFGGKGKMIHLAHANGYPPRGYQQFIQPFLGQYEVIASRYRPLWAGAAFAPSKLKSWQTFADDLIRFMDEQGMRKVIGMGHSMGGNISVLVASQRPDLFEQLVLIDPVIFAYKQYLWTKMIPTALLKRIVPIAKTSSTRRNHWSSKEEVYQSWREKRVFKRMSDEVLQQFIEAAIVEKKEGGFTLAFSREWETQVYVTSPYVYDKVLQLEIPITVIRAEDRSVLSPEIWRNWQQKQPTTKFIDFKDAGHLVPMEHPTALADAIMKSI